MKWLDESLLSARETPVVVFSCPLSVVSGNNPFKSYDKTRNPRGCIPAVQIVMLERRTTDNGPPVTAFEHSEKALDHLGLFFFGFRRLPLFFPFGPRQILVNPGLSDSLQLACGEDGEESPPQVKGLPN